MYCNMPLEVAMNVMLYNFFVFTNRAHYPDKINF